MPCRLSKEEIVAICVLGNKGKKKTRITSALGVSEGTIRYHLKRQSGGAIDGRGNKSHRAECLSEVIAAWFEDRKDEDRPVNVLELHEYLVAEY